MTTQTYNTNVDHTSDAGFRAWGSELSTNLGTLGLVQTADTGQINWTTVTRPGTNTAAGYEIWRFVDSSLYLKLEYGTGGVATGPQMWITVGTGSNGSGTLTGQLSTRSTFALGSAPASTSTTYITYLCRVADAFMFVWKVNGISSLYPMAFLCIGKTVDGSGAATTTGFGVLRMGSSASPSFQSVRIASVAATYTDSVSACVAIPGLPTSSLAGTNYQAYQYFVNVPDVQPFAWANANVIIDIPKLTTYSVAMVASVSHTYFALGALNASSTGGPGAFSGSLYSIGLIYE